MFGLKIIFVTLCFRYLESGLNISAAQKFNNVTKKPLVTGPDDQLILGDTFLFPEHHVFTGIVSKLIKELEKNAFDPELPEEGPAFMDQWMTDPGVNVARTVWHGSASFIGNMAEKLLSKVNNLEKKLQQYLGQRPECLEVAKSYIQALKQFDAVVHSCFGNQYPTQGD